MPTRVLLEGPAIEPLLAQVRDEYGSGVRIISADKVRSGGVGGFFAKQHYELSVEVPDPNEDRNEMAKRPTSDNGHTLERLLERAESQDRLDEPARPAARTVTPATFGQVRPGETTFSRPAAQARPAAAPSPVEDDNFGADEGRGAAHSDTNAAFAELMAGLDSTGHAPLPDFERNPPRPKAGVPLRGEDTPTVRPFRPAATTEAPVNHPHPPKATVPVVSAPPAPAAEPVHVAQHAQPAEHAQPTLAERIGGLGASAVEVDEPVIEEPIETPATSAAAAFGLKPIAATPPPVAAPADSDPVIRNLVSVGMPESMASRITGADTYAGVLSVLAARPSAPGIPDGPGEILVLAGDINLGVPIARHLLDQIGVPENHLLLAATSTAGTGLHSSRLIPGREAAESRVDKLHNAEQAWVVVLDAPVGGTDPLWVNEMCDAIGATAVWAIVDATRKTADTARHLRTLGEVEALVVHGVELTQDPASVLGLELPIFSLDGKPATPHAWAAMLCARIATDVMPVAAPPRRASRTVRP
ncbi:hypothetical protein BJ973_007714 [Actinoplanes tereljensis]|uniref:Flagellar biosynthesis protein FlhF n=1 Tax=Paractinoplanes tereljensis TaxID=571912 RepID=A0A919NT57_9ACTN|nr:hypothetical protein [Actinoplanes tereljensis]GIF24233.1 hypothetical protein Ate02nite_69630 [Actinoplanes tereljensis]